MALIEAQQRVILIADDDQRIQDLVVHAVTQLGFIPLKANDGASAVEFVSNCSMLLACVILDIQMPIMNGVEAAHLIEKVAPNLAIIFISGGFSVAISLRMKQLKAFTMLYKPFSLLELKNTVLQVTGIESIPNTD